MAWTQATRTLLVTLLASLSLCFAGAQTELRMTWYDDGNEGQVLRDLLDRFEADNPDIRVVMDTVPYSSGILEALPLQLASSQGPDMARVTDLGGLSKYYLDLKPYVADTAYWETNFGPFMDWMRPKGSDMLPGLMTQLTVTGPFVNKTLFDQAEVKLPTGDTTWEAWADLTRQVAEATQTTAMVMDRSGHRLAGPAVSEGAKFLNAEGTPVVDDEGMRRVLQLMIDWHADGTMLPDVWVGSGSEYGAGNEQFVNAQVVFYMSGSWQIGQFAETIGDAFDWVAVPNPCGPAACTGMPGGAALVGIKATKYPQEVGKVLDYLASEAVQREFYARTLFIPGHTGLAKQGIAYQTDSQLTEDALNAFTKQVTKLVPLAYELQGYKYNRVLFDTIRDRLTQVFTGELTLDDALTRMQSDIDAGIAEAESSQ